MSSTFDEVLRDLAVIGLGPSLGIDFGVRSGIGEAELRRQISDLYARKYDAFLGYAIDKLGSQQDAEDVVNEAFVRVLRANPDLHVPDELAGYVRDAVTNEANRRGSGISQDRSERVSGDPADLEATLQADGKPFEDRVADEITIGLAIQLLSPREQQVIALRHVEDVSEKDTAARMHVQPGAVKRYRSDAVRKIHAALHGMP